MFVSPPYIKCPKCGGNEYGVLMINSKDYRRRCNGCMYSESYKLPALSKKIVYIDQNALSNMMKSINPETEAYKKGNLDPFFKSLFELLDRLNKYQLIICPDSINHYNESVSSQFYKSLRRVYEQLSHGTSFEFPETIKRFQIHNNFLEWLGENPQPITKDNVIHGSLNEWQDRLIVSVDMGSQTEDAVGNNDYKNRLHENMISVFERWKTEKNRNFNDWYEEERNAIGPAILRTYVEGFLKYSQEGYNESTLNFMTSFVSVLFTELKSVLIKRGYNDDDALLKIREYLNSDYFKETSYLKISSMLYASIAKSAANGRKNPPSPGMDNDIEVISSYSNYCDAMFLDKECHSYLNQQPLKKELGLSDKTFSVNNKEDFLKYLQSILDDCPKEHLKLIDEVYGNDWGEPFIEMFEKINED
ncbi:MAG: hypothetical protein PHO75_02930 [Candidatus Shapirobacteria bacterium]|nr:hypothetical protein [Candidatus Shapirobacteria bacterium]